MRLWMQESQRFVIEHQKGQSGCTTSELAHALQSMPGGFIVAGLTNREDGTTVVSLRHDNRTQVRLIENKGD